MIDRPERCWCPLRARPLLCLRIAIACVIAQALGAASVAVPSSNCYALDNSSHLVDFTSWIGHVFEYEGREGDLAFRFCKDVETMSNLGFVDFGRFDKFNHFVAGSEHVDFVQRFYNGDLKNCEKTYDKLGRTAQVNIICGSCSNDQCKGELGCICNVTYESACRIVVELAIPCQKRGPRVFKGFTVGFHPRTWEIVYNGMTRVGFERSYSDYSFTTEQTHITLYMTAIASLSHLVQKPTIKVSPEDGLDVRLSGSAMTGRSPTSLSPTMLILDWRCEIPQDSPYEIEVNIPVDGYEHIQFTLSKTCERRQNGGGEASTGWAIFGYLSFICTVLSVFTCFGGFVYKTRVQRQRGLDALPGITILSAFLETMSRSSGNSRAEDLNSAFASQASWDREPGYNQATRRPGERKYGAI